MNLKLRYSIIIIDLSLTNPKIQELPGALLPGHPHQVRFLTNSNADISGVNLT